MSQPFTTAQARERGIEEWHLRSRRKWQRVAHGIYAPSERAALPMTLLAAARLRMPPSAVFSGLTAAWLHGLDAPPAFVEMNIPPGIGVSGRAGMKVRRCELKQSEVVTVHNVRATTVERTLSDLSGQLPLMEAVILADRALYLGRTDLKALTAAADAATGRIGVTAFRRVISHAEPKAESHGESRLRMTLVLGGLERPEAQVPIRDSRGVIIGRPDLYYPKQRLGIEYDGGVHRDHLVEDNRRQNLLTEAGVRLLRFTASDVFTRPEQIVAQVRAMLVA